MIIDKQQIWKQLEHLFPDLIDYLPTDREYLLTTVDQVRELAERHRDPRLRFIPNIYECEEFSLAFLAAVRNERGLQACLDQLPIEQRKNLAIGEALGTRFQGVDKGHQVNIFLTAKGIHLIDVQSMKIWKAKKGQDNLFFVSF